MASLADPLKRAFRRLDHHWFNARVHGPLSYVNMQALRFLLIAEMRRKIRKPCDPHGLEVHMLLNHRRMPEGVFGMYSLMRVTDRPMAVLFHDDGTLTPQDLGTLETLFPGCRVCRKKEADEAVIGMLERQGLTRTAFFRRNFVLAPKLLDAAYYSRGKNYLVIDSDVLFFRCPTELFEAGDACAYSVDPISRNYLYSAEAERRFGIRLVDRINSGILNVSRSVIDYEWIERLMEHPALWKDGSPERLAEQAVFAMLFSKFGPCKALPDTYLTAPGRIPPDAVAAHYVLTNMRHYKRYLYEGVVPLLESGGMRAGCSAWRMAAWRCLDGKGLSA